MTLGDWIQTAAVVVGLFAAVSALRIASHDRRAAALQSRLLFELETVTQLVEVLADEQWPPPKVLTAEDRARQARITSLVGALGESRVPRLWHNRFGNRPTPPDSTWKVSMDDIFIREGAQREEALDALNAIAADLQRSEGKRPRARFRRQARMMR